jgi:hypothetical protein
LIDSDGTAGSDVDTQPSDAQECPHHLSGPVTTEVDSAQQPGSTCGRHGDAVRPSACIIDRNGTTITLAADQCVLDMPVNNAVPIDALRCRLPDADCQP